MSTGSKEITSLTPWQLRAIADIRDSKEKKVIVATPRQVGATTMIYALAHSPFALSNSNNLILVHNHQYFPSSVPSIRGVSYRENPATITTPERCDNIFHGCAPYTNIYVDVANYCNNIADVVANIERFIPQSKIVMFVSGIHWHKQGYFQDIKIQYDLGLTSDIRFLSYSPKDCGIDIERFVKHVGYMMNNEQIKSTLNI